MSEPEAEAEDGQTGNQSRSTRKLESKMSKLEDEAEEIESRS